MKDFLSSKTYLKFSIEFNQLKDANENYLSYYFLTNNDFDWNNYLLNETDFRPKSNEHFEHMTGFVPIVIDTQNEDIYCYMPKENKIGVFSAHTIVHNYENLDELLQFFQNLIKSANNG